MSQTLSRRREFLFLYDIRMGNPNGDPDENRPRRLPDGTFYVTDVRLKRFVRDWLKTQDHLILVDRPEDAATNLTGRVQHLLRTKPEAVRRACEEYEKSADASGDEKRQKSRPQARGRAKGDVAEDKGAATSPEGASGEVAPDATPTVGVSSQAQDPEKGRRKADLGRLVVNIILDAFLDARLFGSSLAFKDWDIDPRPKTLTGAVQINIGEVLHPAHEIDIAGTSTFSSKEENRAGTFTTYHGLRYGLIGFNGIANEHSARSSRLTDGDYELFLRALWKGVASAPTANTRTKMGQVPRLLVDITYSAKSEFQFGCLLNYAKVETDGRVPSAIASPDDYILDLQRLVERLSHPNVDRVRYAANPDLRLNPGELPWETMDLDPRPAVGLGT